MRNHDVAIIALIPFAEHAAFYLETFKDKNYRFIFLVQDELKVPKISIDELKKEVQNFKYILFCGIPVRFWKDPIPRWKRAYRKDWVLKPLLWDHWGDFRRFFSKGFLPREQKELVGKNERLVKVSQVAKFLWEFYPYYYIKYQYPVPKLDFRSWVFFTSSQIFQSIEFKNLEESLRKHDFRLAFDTIISRPTSSEYRTDYKPWAQVWGLHCKKYDSFNIF